MELRLQGRVAVVTGGSAGIGLAVARTLLAEGARVAICGRDAARLEAARQSLDASGTSLLAMRCDVLAEPEVLAFRDRVIGQFGDVTALICNAGEAREANFFTATEYEWSEELRLKFFSYIYPIRCFTETLRASGHGAIVCVNSTVSSQPEPHLMTSSAARGGVLNLAKSLATALAPAIRVNTVQMGCISSGQWERRFAKQAVAGQSYDDWLAQEAAKRSIPLGRFGDPTEAADAITYLASPRASYVTGARLEVSGGVTKHV